MPVALNDCWAEGGEGGKDMANLLLPLMEKDASPYCPLYDVNETIPEKLEKIVTRIYGGKGVIFEGKAQKTGKGTRSFRVG